MNGKLLVDLGNLDSREVIDRSAQRRILGILFPDKTDIENIIPAYVDTEQGIMSIWHPVGQSDVDVPCWKTEFWSLLWTKYLAIFASQFTVVLEKGI